MSVPLERLVQHVRRQAQACQQLGSPLYAALLERCADDITAGGPTAEVLAGHEDDPESAVTSLRLLAAVHLLVLSGAAPELAAYYPSAGGTADAEQAWPVLRQVLAERAADIRPLLSQAPQTNEVGRSAALVGGLLFAVAQHQLPVRLLEIGSSAGLNLRADHFWYGHTDAEHSWGPPSSPVRLDGAWAGRVPPLAARLRIATRSGTDIAPIDPTVAEGQLRLLSYVWPDQTERFSRLSAAIAVAEQVPAPVERCDAVTAARRLEPADGHWSVLWHSVMWQYLSRADRHAISEHLDAVGAAATPDAPVGHLYLEPNQSPDANYQFLVMLHSWPDGDRRILAYASPHGVPTTWEAGT